MKKFITNITVFFSFFLFSPSLKAKAFDEAPLIKENFALFGPMTAFGGNILEKGTTQFSLITDLFIGENSYLSDVFPIIYYGIRDNFSIAFSIPFSPANKIDSFYSGGIEDIFIQFEYAYFIKKSSYASNQATIVASFLFPTGSNIKLPATGLGSPGFFLGTTLSRATQNWMFFTSHGALLTTSRNKTKAGETFFYQGGLGRTIGTIDNCVFAFMVELDGIYVWKSNLKGAFVPDSGGNLLYLTPSLWVSRKKTVIQFGAGYPILQNLTGNQSRQYALIGLNIGIKL